MWSSAVESAASTVLAPNHFTARSPAHLATQLQQDQEAACILIRTVSSQRGATYVKLGWCPKMRRKATKRRETRAVKTSLTSLEQLSMEPAVKIEDDLQGWLLDQASALRERRYFSLDCDNLAVIGISPCAAENCRLGGLKLILRKTQAKACATLQRTL